MTTTEQKFDTVLAALEHHADDHAGTHRMTFIDNNHTARSVGYAQVWSLARRAATVLAEHGVRAGDRVVLMQSTSVDFVVSFYGAQCLGAIPVAVARPTRFGGNPAFVSGLNRLCDYLRPAAVLAGTAIADTLRTSSPRIPVVDADRFLTTVSDAGTPEYDVRPVDPGATAFIQSTSGTTGTPKGVVVSHANLAANCAQIADVTGWSADDTIVGWLPLFHDMGLVGTVATPTFTGSDAVLFAPERFLRAPHVWFRAISDYHATLGAAPNFALGYSPDRAADEDMAGVDLSSWRALYCGAEPISPPTVRRFTEFVGRWGAPATLVLPCYGMAEATLILSSTRVGVPWRSDSVDRRRLAEDGVAIDLDGGPDAVEVTDLGPAVVGTELRVVDDRGVGLREDQVGHVEYRGPSAASGYFDLDEVSAERRTPDGWNRSGDLGYLRDGRLRVTGRSKDMVIIRGANYFPTDFEVAAETVDDVRRGCVVAVGYRDVNADTDELALIVETTADSEHHADLTRRIVSAVTTLTGVGPSRVVLVGKNLVPKTTSGKLRRADAARQFLPEVRE